MRSVQVLENRSDSRHQVEPRAAKMIGTNPPSPLQGTTRSR